MKLRGHVVAVATGQPLKRVPVVAEATIGGKAVSAGLHASDDAGYVAFLIPGGATEVTVRALAGAGESVTLALDAGREPRFVLELAAAPAEIDRPAAPLLPSIELPDSRDAAISPRSFGSLAAGALGEGACEQLLQSRLPERQSTFFKTVRYDGPAPEKMALLEHKLSPTSGTGIPEGSGTRAPRLGPELMHSVTEMTKGGAFREQEYVEIRDRAGIELGEVLEFRQSWSPLGHALGEILYSTTLQPMEAQELAVIDWSRDDTFSRSEDVTVRENLIHDLRRDRTIDESVDSELGESQRGWSRAGGIAASASGGVGVVSGSVSGGYAAGDAQSLADRNVQASTGQELVDVTHQASANMRRLNSTVVVHATQAERNALGTRTIRNINRCHSITTLFYSVVRAFVVQTTFVRRRLAVFVPMPFLAFDRALALQQRTALERALLDPSLATAFAALVRLEQADAPNAVDPYCGGSDATRCAAARLEERLSLLAQWHALEQQESKLKPREPVATGNAVADAQAWIGYAAAEAAHVQGNKADSTFLEARYAQLRQQALAEALGIDLGVSSAEPAAVFAQRFSIGLTTSSGPGGNPQTWGRIAVYLEVDGDEVKVWEKPAKGAGGPPLDEVRFPLEVETPERIDVRKISSVRLEWEANDGMDSWAPVGLNIRYRQKRSREWLRLLNTNPGGDGALAKWTALITSGPQVTGSNLGKPQSWTTSVEPDLPDEPDPVERLPPSSTAPADDGEPRDVLSAARPGRPRRVDDELLERALLAHLNGNTGYYSRYILQSGDPKARVELLEAAAATAGVPGLPALLDDNAVGFGGRHAAFLTSIEIDSPDPPEPDDTFIVLPTRGIFAETQLSHCDACEERDITKQAWVENVQDLAPPHIESVSPGPRGAIPDVSAAQVPGSVINITTPPNAPDPAGLAAVFGLLGKGDSFRDMSMASQVADLLKGLTSGSMNLTEAQQKARAVAQQADAAGSSPTSSPHRAPSDQTPTQRIDNVKAAEIAAAAASKLGWSAQDTRDVTKQIVTGGSNPQEDAATGSAPGPGRWFTDAVAKSAIGATDGGAPANQAAIAAAAETWAARPEVMEAYWAFQRRTRTWFFSFNRGLSGAIARPTRLQTGKEWLVLDYRQRIVIADLAGLSPSKIDEKNKTVLSRLTAALAEKWPTDLLAVFQAPDPDAGTESSYTCNTYVGDVLSVAGSPMMRSDGTYESASNIWNGANGKLLPVAPGDVEPGAVVSMHDGRHVEIVTGVDAKAGTFCSRGCGRSTSADFGLEKCAGADRQLNSSHNKFWRIKMH